MTTSYYTLRALARLWNSDLTGTQLLDAYSQNRAELTLVMASDEAEDADAWTLHLLLGAERGAFRSRGYHRARRNSVTLFEDALGRTVTGVRVAERDRFLYLDLDDGTRLTVLLFGPRPNVLWIADDAEPTIRTAFLRDEALRGTAAPLPRPAPEVAAFDAFEARWPPQRKTVRAALARAMPLFDTLLAAEAAHRAGLDGDAAPDTLAEADRRALFEAAHTLDAALHGDALAPQIYWTTPQRGRDEPVQDTVRANAAREDAAREDAVAFGLVPMRHLAETHRAEAFDTLDRALRVYVRRRLGQRRFRALFDPVEKALAAAHQRRARSAEAMLDELATPSRADRYEAFGHLLMAQATNLGPGQEAVDLPNILTDGAPVRIPLDPARSGVENAQRYYDRARRTRQARAHAEDRWQRVQDEAEQAAALLAELRAQKRVADLDRFLKDRKADLEPFTGREAVGEERLPYRRFPLPGGYEAWVGKNAKSNAELTTRHARPFDLWLHARGVPGSHVVVRIRGREDRPGSHVIEAAAALAAHYSDARGGSLVPVIVTEKKYVRPMRVGGPGLVRVDRENVVMVSPNPT
ncbi:MAG: NFACT family protein [Bacteroidota bacterium]